MQTTSTASPKDKLYGLVYDSKALTAMLLRFQSAVNGSIKPKRNNFELATDGKDGLAFVIEKNSQAVNPTLLSRLFDYPSVQRLLEKASSKGFILLRGKTETGFLDIVSGNSFKFHLPGLELRVEETASLRYDTGNEPEIVPPLSDEQLHLEFE